MFVISVHSLGINKYTSCWGGGALGSTWEFEKGLRKGDDSGLFCPIKAGGRGQQPQEATYI